jgi:hypothetical protein
MEVWCKLCSGKHQFLVGCSEQCGALVILYKEIEKYFQECNWREGIMKPNL